MSTEWPLSHLLYGMRILQMGPIKRLIEGAIAIWTTLMKLIIIYYYVIMIDININVYYSRCIMDRARNGTCTCTEIIKLELRVMILCAIYYLMIIKCNNNNNYINSNKTFIMINII